MAGVVTTSLVVQFGSADDAANYHLSAEIDSREAGFNKGVTSFLPGDNPAFLVYKTEELSLQFYHSTGGKTSLGTVIIPQDEFIVFAEQKEVQLSKPPSGGVSLTLYGGKTGAKVTGQSVSLPEKGTAVYRATYNAKAYAYKLTGIPLTIDGKSSFPVVVVIVGTAA